MTSTVCSYCNVSFKYPELYKEHLRGDKSCSNYNANSKVVGFTGDYRFLSNFYNCKIYLDGKLYKSVEAAYVASKTLDEEVKETVRLFDRAADAKAYTKIIISSGKQRTDWCDEVRLEVMERLLRAKFSDTNKELKEKLIATGDKELIEANIWGDRFFGVCRGEGQNHLGKLLMKIRGELKCQQIGSK